MISAANLGVGLCLLAILPLVHGANLQTLFSFQGSSVYPYAGLVQGKDGNFYGTTVNGGAYGGNDGYGTVFRVTTNGTLSILASFANTNGANPQAELIQATDGNLYGTTQNGGTNDIIYGGHGTVFCVTTNGALTSLFCSRAVASAGHLKVTLSKAAMAISMEPEIMVATMATGLCSC